MPEEHPSFYGSGNIPVPAPSALVYEPGHHINLTLSIAKRGLNIRGRVKDNHVGDISDDFS